MSESRGEKVSKGCHNAGAFRLIERTSESRGETPHRKDVMKYWLEALLWRLAFGEPGGRGMHMEPDKKLTEAARKGAGQQHESQWAKRARLEEKLREIVPDENQRAQVLLVVEQIIWGDQR
jgi:hypothetical protein